MGSSRFFVVSSRTIALCGLVILLGIALVTILDIGLRAIFLAPLVGLEDAIKLLSAVVVASFFPFCLLQGHNVTIRFLGKAIGGRANIWLEGFGATVTLAYFALLAWHTVLYAYNEMDKGRYTWTLEWPTAPFWWVIAAIMVGCAILQAWIVYGGLKSGTEGKFSVKSHGDDNDRDAHGA